MNALILIFFLSTSVSQAACLSDSPDLSGEWKTTDSRLLLAIEEAAAEFNQTMGERLSPAHKLIVNLETRVPRTNAEIVKNENEVLITVWGGMLNHPMMNQTTLLLLLCHEIGHFLGGPPLKSRNGWSSSEGQADFHSSRECAKVFLPNEADFLEASVRLTSIYAEVTRQESPDLNRCDETRVERTNFGYPTAQCRLDTLMAGWRGERRPRCWYLGED